jgi:hypothetical protein
MSPSETTTHAPTSKATRRPRQAMALPLEGLSSAQRCRAAAVLEVLAGVRTPAQAASALSLSLPAYYKLENRALRGLIGGCRPLAPGAQPAPGKELDKLRRDCQRLDQEVRRYQALARAAQRAVGLSAPKEPPAKDGAGRRPRRPTVRALKAAALLQADVGAAAAASA